MLMRWHILRTGNNFIENNKIPFKCDLLVFLLRRVWKRDKAYYGLGE
jgi:hypothetical protein